MPSCPRCGASVQASDLICPRCHTSLTTAQPAGGAGSRSVQGVPTPDTSANGLRPASTDADANTSNLTHESWGPGTWGPRRDALNEAPPPERNAASAIPPPPTPAPNMPTPSASAFREYGAHPAFPPHRGYSAPPGPTGASGYPLIPQNGRVPLAPGYPVVPTAPGAPVLPGYTALGPYPGYAVYPYGLPPSKPPNPPGETYRKVVSILAVIASSLALLAGFGLLAVLLLLTINAEGQDTSVVNLLIIGGIAGVVGGGLSLYHATRSLMRRASAPFSLPSFWLLLGATLVVFVAGIGLFASGQPTGPLALADPLILLSGIAPALTILALAAQRLQGTVTWRHLWLSLTCGATLGIGVALIAELLLALWLSSIFGLLNLDPTMLNPDQNNPSEFIALLLLLAVVAPLVEETSKQLGGFFLLPRIKSASEAFLLGLAAGIGFNIVETSQYIGAGQADWIGVAIGRVGAGLIHGMGAAMAGLGWYYLLRGKGIRHRWTLGFGCLLYAYVQHALLNGGELLVAIHFPNWHLDLLGIILDAGVAYAFLLYLLIIGVLLFVTGWLRRTAPRSPGANALDSLRDAPSPPARVTLASQSVRPPAGAGAASGAGDREDIRLSGELPPVANEVGQRNEPGGAA